jgi:hypothetical protein
LDESGKSFGTIVGFDLFLAFCLFGDLVSVYQGLHHREIGFLEDHGDDAAAAAMDKLVNTMKLVQARADGHVHN